MLRVVINDIGAICPRMREIHVNKMAATTQDHVLREYVFISMNLNRTGTLPPTENVKPDLTSSLISSRKRYAW